MKKLRVTVLPGDRLVRYRREGKIPDVDEGWWRSVMWDASRVDLRQETRIGSNSQYAYYRLDRQAGPELMIDCVCGLSGHFNKAEMLKAMGADCNVAWLATRLIPECRRRNKISNNCRAVCLR